MNLKINKIEDSLTEPILDNSLLIPGSPESSVRKIMFKNNTENDYTAFTDENTGSIFFTPKYMLANKDNIINAYILSKEMEESK